MLDHSSFFLSPQAIIILLYFLTTMCIFILLLHVNIALLIMNIASLNKKRLFLFLLLNFTQVALQYNYQSQISFHTFSSRYFIVIVIYSCLENPMDGGAWWAAVHGVAKSRARLSNFTFTFHFHALEKEMATHSSVLAWRIPGTGEPGGLPSMGSHRVGHD